MAVQKIIVGAIQKKAKKLYRDAKGRFTTKAKYELNQRRLATGQFGTKTQAQFNRGFGLWMRAEVGSPNGRMNWEQIATKYPEKMESYVQEFRRKFS